MELATISHFRKITELDRGTNDAELKLDFVSVIRSP